MTRRRAYPADVPRNGGHEVITWSQFDVTGLTETTRTGRVWSVAPAIKGGRSFWVVPDQPDHSEPWVIAVTVIGRRRQIGRADSDQGRFRSTMTGPLPRYRSTGGRVVDQGEVISEAHPDSPTGQLTEQARSRLVQPRVITTPALPSWLYDVLSSVQK